MLFEPTAPVMSTKNDNRNHVDIVRQGGSTLSIESVANEYLFEGEENVLKVVDTSPTRHVDFVSSGTYGTC